MSDYNKGYKKLNVYSKADELVILIYKLTKKFPKDETFGLISQMRRAVVSVVANIVEGYGRNSFKDKIRFYYMARGSLTELEYYIDLSFRLEYFNKKEFSQLEFLRSDVGKLLNGLINSIKNKGYFHVSCH
jgi:four helix bundle protein